MSVPSNVTWKDNPTIGIDQGIYETSDTKKTVLGYRIKVGDRTFHYSRAATALTAGIVVCAPAASTGFGSTNLTLAAATTGAFTLSCTSTSMATADAFMDGYLDIGSGTGQGTLYRVKSNAAGTTAFGVTLYDGIATALTATSKPSLTPNPFNNVFISAAGTGRPVGVVPIAVSSGYYFWLQTWGPAAVTQDGAAGASANMRLSTSGALAAITTGTLGATGNLYIPVAQNIDLASVDQQAALNIVQMVP